MLSLYSPGASALGRQGSQNSHHLMWRRHWVTAAACLHHPRRHAAPTGQKPVKNVLIPTPMALYSTLTDSLTAVDGDDDAEAAAAADRRVSGAALLALVAALAAAADVWQRAASAATAAQRAVAGGRGGLVGTLAVIAAATARTASGAEPGVADFLDRVREWRARHGPVFEASYLSQHVLVVLDPALLPAVLGGRGGRKGLPKSPLYARVANALSPGGEESMTFVSGAADGAWHSTKRALGKAFCASEMRNHVEPIVADKVAVLMAKLLGAADAGARVELVATVGGLTLDVIAEAALGVRFDCLSAPLNKLAPALDTAASAAEEAFLGRQELHPNHQVPVLGELWRLAQGHAAPSAKYTRMHALAEAVAADILARPAPPPGAGGERDRFWAQLAAAVRAGDIRRGRLVSEVAGIMEVGHATTSATLGHTLFLLAAHPEWQARLADELAAAGLFTDGADDASTPAPAPSSAQLEALPVLNAVLSESMRLVPAVSIGTVRVADAEMELGGRRVSAGTHVWVPFDIINKDVAVWGELAREFRPDRWLQMPAAAATAAGTTGSGDGGGDAASADAPDSSGCPFLRELRRAQANSSSSSSSSSSVCGGPAVPPPNHAAFTPFGQGPRQCPGRPLAMYEMRLAIARIVSSVELRVDATFAHAPLHRHQEDGAHVTLHRRRGGATGV